MGLPLVSLISENDELVLHWLIAHKVHSLLHIGDKDPGAYSFDVDYQSGKVLQEGASWFTY